MLASQLAATSLDSSTSSPPSLSHSVGHPSPSPSSVLSLSEQSSEELSDEHAKVAGEMVGKIDDQDVTVHVQEASKVMTPDVRMQELEKDPLSLYSEAIYAYTVSLLFDNGAEKPVADVFISAAQVISSSATFCNKSRKKEGPDVSSVRFKTYR